MTDNEQFRSELDDLIKNPSSVRVLGTTCARIFSVVTASNSRSLVVVMFSYVLSATIAWMLTLGLYWVLNNLVFSWPDFEARATTLAKGIAAIDIPDAKIVAKVEDKSPNFAIIIANADGKPILQIKGNVVRDNSVLLRGMPRQFFLQIEAGPLAPGAATPTLPTLLQDKLVILNLKYEFPIMLFPTTFAIETGTSIHAVEVALDEAIKKFSDSSYAKANNLGVSESAREAIVEETIGPLKGHIGRLPWDVGAARSLNGKIQFMTFLVFFVLLIQIAGRWYLHILLENRVRHSRQLAVLWNPQRRLTIPDAARLRLAAIRVESQLRRRTSLLGCYATFACLRTFIASADGYLLGGGHAVRDYVDPETDNILNTRQALLGLVKYAIWAIPSIGFVGTVVGIGASLLETINVQAQDESAKAVARSLVSSSIAVAFDTTLWALLLAIAGMLAYNVLMQLEELVVLNAKGDSQRQFLRANREKQALYGIPRVAAVGMSRRATSRSFVWVLLAIIFLLSTAYLLRR